MIDTVNVVVVKNGMASEVYSFHDNDQGNKQAEKKFQDVCSVEVSNWDEYTPEDKDSDLEDGYCQFGKGYIQIIHSEGGFHE